MATRREYTAEFKREAVRLAEEGLIEINESLIEEA